MNYNTTKGLTTSRLKLPQTTPPDKPSLFLVGVIILLAIAFLISSNNRPQTENSPQIVSEVEYETQETQKILDEELKKTKNNRGYYGK